jgi:hypothetical protein
VASGSDFSTRAFGAGGASWLMGSSSSSLIGCSSES